MNVRDSGERKGGDLGEKKGCMGIEPRLEISEKNG